MSEPILVGPDSELQFAHDWSTNYLASGVTISSRQWSISPSSGITLTNDTTATVKVAGVSAGKVYRLKEVVVLSNGEEDQQEIIFRCR